MIYEPEAGIGGTVVPRSSAEAAVGEIRIGKGMIHQQRRVVQGPLMHPGRAPRRFACWCVGRQTLWRLRWIGAWHPVCLVHRYFPQYSFATFGAAGLSYKTRLGPCGDGNEKCFAQAANTWAEIQQATEDAYDRSADCTFTSFNGYEWTASAETGR